MCYSNMNQEYEVSFEPRRFFSKEEKIQMLKEYKNYLDKESKGVTEKIVEMEKHPDNEITQDAE